MNQTEIIEKVFSELERRVPESFMVPEIYTGKVVNSGGDCMVPWIVIPEAEPEDRETILVRLTAPGYLDCTEWEEIETVQDLIQWFESNTDYPEEPKLTYIVRNIDNVDIENPQYIILYSDITYDSGLLVRIGPSGDAVQVYRFY